MNIRQLVVDARGCQGPLDDAAALMDALKAAAARVGAQVREESRAVFVPHGVTAVVILAESHLLVSTWPEHRLALVDILLCNDRMDPHDAWDVIAEALRPVEAMKQQITRTVG
jgi:S-adenosylmethionine decarboxylase